MKIILDLTKLQPANLAFHYGRPVLRKSKHNITCFSFFWQKRLPAAIFSMAESTPTYLKMGTVRFGPPVQRTGP